MIEYNISDEDRAEMKRVVVGWPRAARLSEGAVWIFHMIGHGEKILLYRPDFCVLVTRGLLLTDPRLLRQHFRDLQAVETTHVDELRASGFISPLSQFG